MGLSLDHAAAFPLKHELMTSVPDDCGWEASHLTEVEEENRAATNPYMTNSLWCDAITDHHK